MAIRLLAGDIGGTKTILRLNQVEGDTTQTLAESTYPSADFDHLNPMIETFLATVDGERPQVACLAIAGPVLNDTCQLTNLSWQLNGRQMEKALEIPRIHLMNDFAAIGYGILALKDDDLKTLQDQPIQAQSNIAVLGAGTGLGEALLVWQQENYQVLAIEGGHTDFPARNELEIGLLQYLQGKHGRISVERVVSGQGIYAIYEYLRDTHFAPESAAVKIAMESQDPTAVVGQYGLKNSDPLCTKAVEIFVSAYGAEAGNLALKSLPFGGLYIAGGVAPKLLPKLQDGLFLDSFLDKGRMEKLLKTIRVSVILNPKVGLMGAALFAERLMKTA
ncbi:Glucokinase [Acaryochloris thomasi RCC1774]|uniref:Glucokinase n=1 Tax=Acaryochloris thomasi RCC1774 TaxID=1764569 RepID=A0A2W1K0Z5_9CYAN|nr:glucokinase [Acaryochloris thomasi]PZD75164.1 Glucokinase [Acaryochloris thomasi RCC1774]